MYVCKAINNFFFFSLNNGIIMVINTTPLHSLHCRYSSLQHYHSLSSPSTFSFLIHNPNMDNFSTEMFGITESQDFTNFYIAALFTNGEMKLCEDGVKFICESPKIFHIPYNCRYNVVKQKVCATISCPLNTSINNLYFRRPTITFEGHIMYEAF